MVIRSLIATSLLLIATYSLTAQSAVSTFEFIENKGQFDKAVKFKGELPSGEFYLHGNGFTIVLHNQEELGRLMRHQHGLDLKSGAAQRSGRAPTKKDEKNEPPGGPGENKFMLHSHAYRVQFLGGNENAEMSPDKAINTYNNYFIGNDRSKWVSHAKIYQAVTYKNVYPNIDVRYYSESGTLKYDIIVHPGGDVGKVALRYEGADKLVLKNNELLVKTSVGDVRELYPYTYQFDHIKGRKEIKCSYVLDRGNTVRFRMDNYDRNATLIIDPTLVFSTYARSTGNNWGYTATPGPDGSLFGGGIVFDTGFPTNPGAFQQQKAGLAGIVDIGIIKFSPDGRDRVYATYIGGTADDFPHSLIADAAGNLIMLGRTYSTTSYPTTVPIVGTGGACDIVVTKLTPGGDGLVGSMIIGGDLDDGVNIEDQFQTGSYRAVSLLKNYGDDSHSEVIIDGAGNIYVAAQTRSAGNFPIRGAVFQPTPQGDQEGVIMKINPDCDAVIWSSFLGGDEDDAAFVLALQPNTNNIYVAGGTYSDNLLPPAIAGVIDNTHNGLADAYIAVISNDGTALITGTYLGTASDDIIYGIKFDRNGFPYVMGVSRGSWPVINALYGNPGSKQFVSKLQPDLSAYVYSTVFGNGNPLPNISPVAFMVDRCENVYVSGWGGWTSPTQPIDPYNLSDVVGMPVTADALKSTTDGHDFYFMVLRKDAESLLYGSFFGQTGGTGEHVDGGTSRFDESGAIYMAICANCFQQSPPPITQPFPTTPGAWGPVNPVIQGCNLAAVKISFNFSGVASGPKPFIGGVQDTVGCIPFDITFRDTVRNARRYLWDFGDGSPQVESTNFEISHTYTAIGTYTIRLIAIDSTTCNIRDTAYTTIYARDDQALLAMDVDRLEPCGALSYLFSNISTAPAGEPFTNNSFIWDFGDGTRVPSGLGDVTHAYANPGPYTVRLIMVDTNYCNSPDSIPFNLTVAEQVRAQIEDVDPGCVPYTVQFDNSSLAGQTYRWEFDDGTISTEMNPVHTFTDVRSYTVKLVVTDSTTCNIIDSTTITVIVNPLPQAAFTSTPVPAVENTPTVFHNFSINGIRHKWLFGDGDSTIKTTMDTVMHQYDSTGSYNACLITYNQFDCPDTVCHDVQALVRPLMDVPNAFTPGRGGQNSVVVVAGFGIGRMTWRIYNRWGQVVFESNNRKRGWDGTYKGVLQPMDVYAYTLDVEFTDGTKARKTGDITLIR